MAETSRIRALQNLSAQLPVANKRIATGQQAARDIQLQQAVAKAPSAASITTTAQATGAAAAQQAGQQAVERAQQQVQQAGRIGQAGLAEQEIATRGALAQQELGAREQKMSNAQRLEALAQGTKKELVDSQMQLERDANGMTRFNTIQLADYARANARSDEEYKNYAQQAEQASRRSELVWQRAHQLVMEDLDHKYSLAKQRKDQKAAQAIINIKAEANAAMQRELDRKANRKAAWASGGTVVGAVVGGVVGGVVGNAPGALAGAAAGSAVGGAAGSFAESQIYK